jgi:hypothetical protein
MKSHKLLLEFVFCDCVAALRLDVDPIKRIFNYGKI